MHELKAKYNIRGWLIDINDTNDLADEYPLEHSDMFAFKISYNQPIDVTEGINELYNGNISETYWRTAKDNVLGSYGYTYDGLNRLRKGFYRRPSTTHAYEGTYNESLTYDKNGNIKTLQRNDGFKARLPGTSRVIIVEKPRFSFPKNSTVPEVKRNWYMKYPEQYGKTIRIPLRGNSEKDVIKIQ